MTHHTLTPASVRASLRWAPILSVCFVVRVSAAAFVSSGIVPKRSNSPRGAEIRRGRGTKPSAASSSALAMSGASLRRKVAAGGEGESGEGDIPIGAQEAVVKLKGCLVEESGGRYYCTADEDGDGAAVSIGGNALTAGVRYGLNEGMTIRDGGGDEYEVKIEGGSPPGDVAMAMMFHAMKAGFADAEDEGAGPN